MFVILTFRVLNRIYTSSRQSSTRMHLLSDLNLGVIAPSVSEKYFSEVFICSLPCGDSSFWLDLDSRVFDKNSWLVKLLSVIISFSILASCVLIEDNLLLWNSIGLFYQKN